MTALLDPAIAIPARNEEERLPQLIEALGQQTWITATSRVLPVTIVLNNCSDRSGDAVREAAAKQPWLRIDLVEVEFHGPAAHVGQARRLAAERALKAAGPASTAAVLTGDAGSVPVPDWVEKNLLALAGGADLVGGLIIGDETEEAALGEGFLRRAELQARYAALADQLTSLIDPLPFDPWPRHHDHTGASLCVRGDVLQAVGGLPALSFREDLGLVSRARSAGFRLRRDPAVRVHVSAGLEGRAPGGMAETLKAWVQAEANHVPQLVEAPEQVEARATRRFLLRHLDMKGADSQHAAAHKLGIDPAALEAARTAGLNGIALAERFAPDEPDAPATVPIEAAIARLSELVAERESTCVAA